MSVETIATHDVTLSPAMQSIARNYLAARARAGEAILDAARYLAEARSAAQYGEWGVFLESTGTREDTATRMIAIAERAGTDPQYARAIRDGRLAFTAAFELLSAPAETQRRAIESTAPTAAKAIRDEKHAAKLRTSAEFPDASVEQAIAERTPEDLIAAGVDMRRHGVLFTAAGERGLMSGWTTGIALPFAVVVAQARREIARRTAPSIVVGQRTDPHKPDPKEPPDAIETEDDISDIRASADTLGLLLVWEDDTVILYWPEEDIDQLVGMGYDDARHWLATEGVRQAEARRAPKEPPPAWPERDPADEERLEELIENDRIPEAGMRIDAETDDQGGRDRTAYEAKERADADLLSTAEMELASGNVAYARQLLDRVQVSTMRRDQLLRALPLRAARTFLDDQRARLLKFSPGAMISQVTYRAALDHIAALLDVAE